MKSQHKKKQTRRDSLPSYQVVINVPGITPNSRIGDLTAKQFVELLLQVSSQNRARAQSPQLVKGLVNQIGRQFKENALGRTDALSKKVLKTQLALLKRLPAGINAAPQKGVRVR